MDRSDIKRTIDREIKKECGKKGIEFSNLKLDQNFNLLQTGVFDSLGILQLISTLEEELGIEVDLSEYSPEEFTHYKTLVDILEPSGNLDLKSPLK